MPNLDEIKARRKKITPGEWVFEQSIFAERSCVGCPETGYALFESNDGNHDDLIFCANAPTDIDWLVAEAERLRTEKAQAEAERDVLLHELLKETHSHLCEDPERPCPFDEETEGEYCSNECANADPKTCWRKYAQQQAERKGA